MGLACQLTWKSEDEPPWQTLCLLTSPNCVNGEHHGTHLRLGVQEDKGGDQWRKTAMSGVIKQSPSGDHAERGISLGSACNFFQQDPKNPVHRSN